MDAATAVTTMSAAVARRFGPPEVVAVERVPKPVPARDEVLVRAACLDREHRRPPPSREGPAEGTRLPRLSSRSGSSARASRSSAWTAPVWSRPSGGRDGVRARRRGHRDAAARAWAATPSTSPSSASGAIARKPAGMSFEDAAALVFGGYTAVSFLDRVELGPGTDVLVNGASGAVGTAVVQLAAHAGARVTAVCSGRNADLVRSLGAQRVIDYADRGLRGRRRALRRHRRVRRQRALRSQPPRDEARRGPAARDLRPARACWASGSSRGAAECSSRTRARCSAPPVDGRDRAPRRGGRPSTGHRSDVRPRRHRRGASLRRHRHASAAVWSCGSVPESTAG